MLFSRSILEQFSVDEKTLQKRYRGRGNVFRESTSLKRIYMDGYWIIKTIEVCNKLVAIVIVFEASSRAAGEP